MRDSSAPPAIRDGGIHVHGNVVGLRASRGFLWGHERGLRVAPRWPLHDPCPAGIVRCPVRRYVDDISSASREGLFGQGGQMLDLLSSLGGFPSDGAKSVSDSIQMRPRGVDVAARRADMLVT